MNQDADKYDDPNADLNAGIEIVGEAVGPHGPLIPMDAGPIRFRGQEWTRHQISRDTGIGVTHISKIFRGTRFPSYKNMVKLAAYFRVSIETLALEILPPRTVTTKSGNQIQIHAPTEEH